MNPIAVHFSSITVSKLVLVTPEGYVHPDGAQLPINTAGFHIRELLALLPRRRLLQQPACAQSSCSWCSLRANVGSTADTAIHDARPEIQAAAHCHSLHGKAWSVFGKAIDIMTQDACLFYDNCAVYKNFGGIVLAPEEGKNIAEALGPKVRLFLSDSSGSWTCIDAALTPPGSAVQSMHLAESRTLDSRHDRWRSGVLLLGPCVPPPV